jgi:light-regulated signal transduction histidine kinase (bacteriophytochrome)
VAVFKALSARDKQESTGIGLALVKKKVELYDGKVWMESEVGEGARFSIPFQKIIRTFLRVLRISVDSWIH